MERWWTRPAVVACNKPHFGLGNRMRVTLGSKMLAELEGRAFAYVWPTGRRFGPELTDLWRFPSPTVPLMATKVLSVRWPYLDAQLTWLNDRQRTRRLWLIRTAHALHLPLDATPWEQAFRDLSPVRRVADRIRSFFDSDLRGGPYIGVMIRAHQHSHAKTLEVSPVEWYIRRMSAIREQYPDVSFFISCDVPEVKHDVAAKIGGCSFLDESAPYNSPAAVSQAVVDLYLLAGSDHLIGPYYSSFVEMAQILAGPGQALETAADEIPPPVILGARGEVDDPVRPAGRRC